jgi:hypothetical protein
MEQQWTHTNHSLTMQENAIRSESVEAHQKDAQLRLAHLPRQRKTNNKLFRDRDIYKIL